MFDIDKLDPRLVKAFTSLGVSALIEADDNNVRAVTKMALSSNGKKFKFLVVCEPALFARTVFPDPNTGATEVSEGGLTAADAVSHTELLIREFEELRNGNSSIRH